MLDAVKVSTRRTLMEFVCPTVNRQLFLFFESRDTSKILPVNTV